jgi:drug/metabolite transporter (DMT)-like permease
MNAILIIVIISVISLFADVVLKKASSDNNIFLIILGCMLYVVDALGWFYAYKYSKFSTVGIIYSLVVIFCSIAIGLFLFKEKIVLKEILGICFGAIALILLSGR